MLDGEKRRERILKEIQNSEMPISGTHLSKKFEVSRQVVVQDVALLRATGYDILATARGYILNEEVDKMVQRVISVKHSSKDTENELNIIIDNGGRVRNVIIIHPVYGEIVANLMLKTRREIKQFVEKIRETNANTLLNLTQGEHMHTIEATSEEELDIIEHELDRNGYIY